MEIVYENPWFKVEKHGKMHFVSENQKKNSAAVILFVDDKYLVLVEVFRIAINKMCIETPRGYGVGDESSMAAAIRECEEETGFIVYPSNIRKLGEMSPNTGMLASTIDLFVATASMSDRLPQFDEDKEISSVIFVEKENISTFIKEKNISDSFLLSGLGLYLLT